MTVKLIRLSTVFIGALAIVSSTALLADGITEKREALRVCADPNYMPFSHKDKSGYENQIADLIGKELKLPVTYTWFPQRMGFIRNTLKKKEFGSDKYRCDLVIGVPKEFDFAKATIPYMHSTYALVTLKEGKLKELKQGNDLVKLPSEKLDDIKIGITERSPGAVWLARYALYGQMTPYIAQSGDPDEFPNQPMYNDLLAGKIDAAIVWGPTAAYFSRLSPKKINFLPLQSERGVRFDFSISTAVRYGDDKWKNQIEAILRKNTDKINEILNKAGIPLLANKIKENSGKDGDNKPAVTASN